MNEEPVRLSLRVELELDDGGDSEELEEIVESLRTELCETPAEVERPAEDASPPPGAKGVGQTAVQVLVISGQALVLEMAVDYVKDWITRQRRRCNVRLDLPGGGSVVLSELSTDEARHLIAGLAANPPS